MKGRTVRGTAAPAANYTIDASASPSHRRVAACAALLAASAIALVAGGGDAGGSAGDASTTAAAPTFSSTAAPPATEPEATATAEPPPETAASAEAELQEVLPTREPSGETVVYQRPDGVQLVGGGSPGRLDAGFVYAPGNGLEAVANVGSDGDGNTTTRVLVSDARTGDSVMVKMVPGAWGFRSPWRTVRPRAWPGAGRASSCRTSTTRAASPRVSTVRPETAPILLQPVAGATFYALSATGAR